jgi:hypothetical protein
MVTAPPSPVIACPAAQSATSSTGQAVSVSYPQPTVSGGAAPVTTTCSPASASAFGLGTTSVACAATDALQQTASCSFAVSVAAGVVPPPPPPPPAPATIQCPVNQTAASTDGGPVAVSYPAAIVSGGAAPVTSACSPASGTVFSVGSTNVTCSATDSLSRTTACQFSTLVLAPPAPPPPPPSSGDPTTWPLVQPSNLVYQGAFRLPSSSNNGAFDFGGSPMTFNPANNSLFVGNYYGQLAEVTIPSPVDSAVVSVLPFAGYLQGFADPTEGHLQSASNDPSNGAGLSGLLAYGGNLYGTAAVYYDANNTQTVSHYRHSLSLSTTSFSGFSAVWQPTTADVANGVPALASGYASGYLAAVPTAWQSLLGGPAISGQWGLPIINRESYGPDAIVWDPSQLGSQNGKSLLYYTNPHQTLGAWANASPMWGGTATNGGVVLVDRTRTALFFGRNGLGTFCYGPGTGDPAVAGTLAPGGGGELWCYDPTSSDKGQHAYPYVYQVWAYDLNDLAAVKSGSKQPWQVMPYATWTLNLPTSDASMKGLGGVGYDPTNQLVYVSQLRADPDGYADRAVIHVFKIQ